MKIYDIPQTTKINISMVFGNKELVFEATILTRYGDGILITPVYLDGKAIDFCSNANFDYKDRYTDVRHVFHVDTISRLCFSGSDFHLITGREIINYSDQRRAKRYQVQRIGTALVNRKINTSVIVNDISMRGISVMVNKKTDVIHIGDDLEVSFLKHGILKRITAKCKVVRQFEISGYTAYGCELYGQSLELTAYILDKKAQLSEKTGIKNFENANIAG